MNLPAEQSQPLPQLEIAAQQPNVPNASRVLDYSNPTRPKPPAYPWVAVTLGVISAAIAIVSGLLLVTSIVNLFNPPAPGQWEADMDRNRSWEFFFFFLIMFLVFASILAIVGRHIRDYRKASEEFYKPTKPA